MSPQHNMRANAKRSLLFSCGTIAARVQELGGQISCDYVQQELLL
ncbi:MAG: hypothetical protein ACRERE_18040 [Candidatus Entotheonellia bacterium]